MEGRYEPGKHWKLQELSRDIKVRVSCTEDELQVVGQLRQHLRRVEI